MTDKMSEWDKQMAAIDKAIDRMPEAPPDAPASATAAKGGKAIGAGERAALPASPAGRGAAAGAWTRVTLSAVLAVAVTQWPYAHGCGLALAGYMAVLASVAGAGTWSAVASWRHHRAVPHILSLLVTLTGLALVANEILIRTLYGVGDLSWVCP